ncbi:MAG: CoA-binding protein [Planctomycetota bacterium]|nr:CoA-binding protein [Planctomycetota bacterium]
MVHKKQRVVVVGASPKPDRYSNLALRLLVEHGHEVVPINPVVSSIEGIPVVPRLEDLSGHVDTVTLYVSGKISSVLEGPLTTLHPDRVIFNPGTENPTLCAALQAEGIRTEEACTLVLLNTDQF